MTLLPGFVTERLSYLTVGSAQPDLKATWRS
jgi:hypothetical protein